MVIEGTTLCARNAYILSKIAKRNSMDVKAKDLLCLCTQQSTSL